MAWRAPFFPKADCPPLLSLSIKLVCVFITLYPTHTSFIDKLNSILCVCITLYYSMCVHYIVLYII